MAREMCWNKRQSHLKPWWCAMPLLKYGLLVDVDRLLWELLLLIHKPSNIISPFFLHLSQFLALLVLWVQNQGLSWVKVPSNSCNRPKKQLLLAFIWWLEQETQVHLTFCQARQLPLTGKVCCWLLTMRTIHRQQAECGWDFSQGSEPRLKADPGPS